jgi:hypothetical protein
VNTPADNGPVNVHAVLYDDLLINRISSRAHTPSDRAERLLVAWVDDVRPRRIEAKS